MSQWRAISETMTPVPSPSHTHNYLPHVRSVANTPWVGIESGAKRLLDRLQRYFIAQAFEHSHIKAVFCYEQFWKNTSMRLLFQFVRLILIDAPLAASILAALITLTRHLWPFRVLMVDKFLKTVENQRLVLLFGVSD